jgi:hypothetical protein
MTKPGLLISLWTNESFEIHTTTVTTTTSKYERNQRLFSEGWPTKITLFCSEMRNWGSEPMIIQCSATSEFPMGTSTTEPREWTIYWETGRIER